MHTHAQHTHLLIPYAHSIITQDGVIVEHAFGREYPELEGGGLSRYDLVLHCGGCMIDQQKMRARYVHFG